MYFDILTTTAVVDELRGLLIGGRVQDVLDITEDVIGLEVYANHQRHYLLLSAENQTPRVQLVEGKLRRGLPKPTQVALLMRRYVEGAEVADITQPPWERMISFHLDGPEGVSQLIVEAVERRANVLLVQEGRILDCIRRVGPEENRVRLSLPGHDYAPPPPQVGKTRPDAIILEEVEALLDADPGKPAWRALTGRLIGVSPLLGKELVYRAMGTATIKAGDTSARALLGAIQALWPPLLRREWQPGICRDEGGGVTAFAVYPITYLPCWEPVGSINAAMSAYYGAPVGADAYDAAKVPVRAQVAEAVERVGRKAESLRESLRSEAEMIRLRQSGELLLAYQYTIPRGASHFSAEYEPDQPPLNIDLDPSLSPLDNAKRYFERYDKAKKALAGVPELLRAAENELAFLRQLDADLTFAANWPEIDEVRDALEREGYWRGPKQARPRGGQSAPLRLTVEGFTVWVGRNSRQNDAVTFGKGSPDDLWLHARGVPGAHVIVKTEGRSVPDSVIERAAELAAYFSTYRNEGRALVDVTRRKHVRKIKGGKAGMVTYRNEEPREVQPRGPE